MKASVANSVPMCESMCVGSKPIVRARSSWARISRSTSSAVAFLTTDATLGQSAPSGSTRPGTAGLPATGPHRYDFHSEVSVRCRPASGRAALIHSTACGTHGVGIITLREFATPFSIASMVPSSVSYDMPTSSTWRMSARVPFGQPSFSA